TRYMPLSFSAVTKQTARGTRRIELCGSLQSRTVIGEFNAALASRRNVGNLRTLTDPVRLAAVISRAMFVSTLGCCRDPGETRIRLLFSTSWQQVPELGVAQSSAWSVLNEFARARLFRFRADALGHDFRGDSLLERHMNAKKLV